MKENQEIMAKSLEIAALMLGETLEGREEERIEAVLTGYLPLAKLIYQRISNVQLAACCASHRRIAKGRGFPV